MGGDDMNEIVGNPSLCRRSSDQVELGMERHRPRADAAADAVPPLDAGPDPPAQGRDGERRRDDHAGEPDADASRGRRRQRARTADGGTVVTLAGSVAHMETTADAFGSSGVYATARLTVDVRVARTPRRSSTPTGGAHRPSSRARSCRRSPASWR
jgi:hypothetical protein